MGGIYGGEQGLNAGELLVYGYLSIFGACSQQPILIQTRSNTPTRILPVEGWTVEDLQLYNRQLGNGHSHGVLKVTLTLQNHFVKMTTSEGYCSFRAH